MTTFSVTYLKYGMLRQRDAGRPSLPFARRPPLAIGHLFLQRHPCCFASKQKYTNVFPSLYNFYTTDVLPTAWKVWPRAMRLRDHTAAAKDARIDDPILSLFILQTRK